ncbi:MAG: stage II sporulation protein M [Candidatus Aenigmarchaeota archaeon]|nr:stage II sporulation protein M [Candidatus Aenigmarchaeota archaeon]
MVLESFISSRELEKRPIEMLAYSIIVASISIWSAYIIFPTAASIVFLFLISIALVPVIYGTIKDDELREENADRSVSLGFFERHGTVLKIYAYFFLGIIIATSFWYMFLPEQQAEVMFALEIETTEALGAFNSSYGFPEILANNLKVMLLSFLISFIFGTGAIFILSWNAAVVGIFIGNIGKDLIHIHSSKIIALIMALVQGLSGIALHGIPEIAAYCIAGMAGAILSIGMTKGHKTDIIMNDSTKLFLISVAIIVAAAFIEVYITPAL